MAKVELKKPVVDEISELLKDAKSAVLVDYRGLTVEQDTALRKQLREAGVVYKVYKNTMINFAIKGTEFEELGKHLEGPTAIAVSSEDATAPARVLYNFAKTAEALEMKAQIENQAVKNEEKIDAMISKTIDKLNKDTMKNAETLLKERINNGDMSALEEYK